ncbi:MAG TPA: cytochrome c peroxidase, partial [Chloroflexota bacterium]|nr:cytochrome c peroxidase [Chloroflexota bacterium]
MLQFAAALRDVRLRASPLRLYRFGGLVLMAAGGAAVASAVLTGTLFAQAAPPPAPPHPVVPPTPLKTVAVPRPDLSEYVVNNAELVVLGKALFWDMQTGGDSVQACASCHFHAGADNRATNTLNAGANSVFSVRQAGETLQTTDFPFHKLANPEDARSVVVRDSDDVVGSQGVFKTHFDALAPGGAADKCTRLG